MANKMMVTLTGNLTADPELRQANGTPVVNVTVAVTPQRWDRNQNKFVDAEAMFYNVSVWRKQAENVAASLHKGDRVVVHGEMTNGDWIDKEGNKRKDFRVTADEIGPSLLFATAQPVKAVSNNGGGYQQQAPAQQQSAPAADQWASDGNQGGYDDPPF